MHNEHTTHDKNTHVEEEEMTDENIKDKISSTNITELEQIHESLIKFSNMTHQIYIKISTIIEEEINLIKKLNTDNLDMPVILINVLTREIATCFTYFLEKCNPDKDGYITHDDYIEGLNFYKNIAHESLDLNIEAVSKILIEKFGK
jgi:hypothetical protein